MQNYTKSHIKSLKPAATLAINEKCKKLREEGKKVFNFGFGGSPFSIPDKIVSALKNNAHKKEYLPSVGLKNLREAISKYINHSNVNFSQEMKKDYCKNIIKKDLLPHLGNNNKKKISRKQWKINV